MVDSYKPPREFCFAKEKQVKCPFNPLHVMGSSSLQRHVIRCMKNYPDFVACPFNSLHRFADNELLQNHMAVCKSKPIENKYDIKGCEELVHGPSNNNQVGDDDYENWDTEYEQV